MAHRHPLEDEPVTRAANEHGCPVETLHGVLDRFDEFTGPRLDGVIENVGAGIHPDRAVVERDPERITLQVDSATFRHPYMQIDWEDHTGPLRDDGRGHEAARSVLEDAIVDAHRYYAVDADVAPDDEDLHPLTTWVPRIFELEAGGMSIQEARAHVLRDSGRTQKEVRDRMDLPSTSAAKNALHRGDEKVRTARRLLDAAGRDG